jgi:hypothetical protein
VNEPFALQLNREIRVLYNCGGLDGMTTRMLKMAITLGMITALAGPRAATAQSCMRASEMQPQDRTAIERSAQQIFDHASRGDTEGLRANTVTNYFSGIAGVVNDNRTALSGASVQLRAEYLLDSGAAGGGHFYCGVFTSQGLTAGGAEFYLPGLSAGRYAIVIEDVNGSKGPFAMTEILQESGGWKLAGLYFRPESAAGHDGLWYRAQAKQFQAKGQTLNAWLYYITAWELMAPVKFMNTRLLGRIGEEARAIEPKDLPSQGKPMAFSAGGKTYQITELGSYFSPSGVDVQLRYSVPSTADFNATQADAHNLATAFAAQHPELKDSFNAIWAHAIDGKGGDVAGLATLKPPASQTPAFTPTQAPSDVDGNDPALPKRSSQ